jgi:basic membrane protein A
MFGRFVLTVLLLALCFPLAGCAKKASTVPKTRIALLTDAAGLDDHSFNRMAATGLADCVKQTGVAVTTAVPKSPGDYEGQLTLLATQAFDAVVAVGDSQAPDVSSVARRFEETHFALIGGVVTAPNVESITFNEQEGSFLAGALAAQFSRTKRIAFLGGARIPPLAAAEAGFIAGAREIDPRVRVGAQYVGSFADETRAKKIARELFASGVDVVYVVAGKAGLGAIAETREPGGGYAIGADADQTALAPGRVLASVVKRVDRAAERVCLETIGHKPVSGHTELGLADGGVELAGFDTARGLVDAPTIARLERLRSAIVRGALKPPATLSELANFTPGAQ